MIEIEAGTLFGGRYEIVKCLGSGGMGVVYLARDPRYQDFLVAIKVLYQNAIRTPQSRDRFRTEIVASYRVNHRNIVRAYEYFDEDDIQAYAMEYVEGKDLKEKMKEGKLDGKEAAGILRQVASGLEAVHSEGILHRDLKPENIMITPRGVVKIADFGVARLKGELTSITHSGVMVGTPKYISPEYIETGECDHRGDLYALGVIGYELVSGSSPFRSGTRVSVLLERFKTRPAPLRKVVPDCSKELAQVIAKAMSFSLNKRYQSAADLREDLECLELDKPLIHINGDEFTEEPNTDDSIQGIEKEEPKVLRIGPETVVQHSTIPVSEKPSGSSLNILVSLISLIIIGAVLATGYFAYKYYLEGSTGLDAIKAGSYKGFAIGLAGEEAQSPMRINKTEDQFNIEIDNERCQSVSSSAANIFRCAGFVYEITVDLVQEKHIAGSVKELSTGVSGTWMVAQKVSD